MNTQKIFLFFIILILLSSLVVAVPPFQTSDTTTDNLDIVFPKFEYYSTNIDIDFHFHVYNSTGKQMIAGNSTCEFHLYNSSGNEIVTLDGIIGTDNGGEEFEVKVNSANLSYAGQYGYTFTCESLEGEYGFLSNSFITNFAGIEPLTDGTPLLGMILAPLLLAFLIMFGGMHLNSETHGVLKIFLFLFPVIPYWASIHFSFVVLARYYNLVELQNAMSDTVFWAGLIFFTLVSYFMIYTLICMFTRIKENREEKLEY